MYVRVKDGKPREPNKLKGLLVPHVDVIDAKNKIEALLGFLWVNSTVSGACR
jgi:hypothetical protein